MLDVCFVLMPYASVERPSIAIGLLKAALSKEGIKSQALYANLQFAEEIGLNRYELINYRLPSDLLGEWTFSESAFPDFSPSNEEYFQLINLDPEQQEISWEIRKAAGKFVDRVASQILDLQPRIVSFSSTFQQHCPSLAVLRRIRQLNPSIITLMGGANCESQMGLTTYQEFPWVDFVVSGESDNLFAELCRLILTNGRDIDPKKLPYGVMGPAHRNKGEVPLVAPRATVNNLDDIPTPDYDDYFEALGNSSLNSIVHPGLAVETSRGCWWGQRSHCTFCGLNGNGMAYRAKSSTRVIDEFSDLSRRYKIRKFLVVDNILSMDHLAEILPIFATQKEHYKIAYETKANLSRQQVKQLVEAGVTWIQPGIEGLHDSVLKLMKKGSNAAINVQLLKWAREYGLQVSWNILCHFPGESDEWYLEMAQWLPLIIHLQPPSHFFRISYQRFSPYHERPEDFGIKLVPCKSYAYIYPLSPKAIIDLAYFFEDTLKHNCDGSLLAKETQRPGLEAVLSCLLEWIELFRSASPPMLCMSERDEDLQIIDTRPCAIEGLINLTGLHKKIYLLCDQALTSKEIIKALRDKHGLTLSWEEIESTVNDLQNLKILVKLSSRFLSLAISDNMLSLCSYEDFPGGYVDIYGSIPILDK